MIDGYTHVDMNTADPLEDLRMRMASAGVTLAFVIETLDRRNYPCIQQLMMKPSEQFRGALCFRVDEQKALCEQLKSESIAGLRVRTADLVHLGSLVESLESSGKWLVAHAELGVGPLRDTLLKLVEEHTGLRIYLPHLGWPRRNRKNDREWDAAMRDLSSLQNCVVGISGLATFSTELYPHRDIHEFSIRLHDLFGGRLTIGSDYPMFQKEMYPEYMYLAQQWASGPNGTPAPIPVFAFP